MPRFMAARSRRKLGRSGASLSGRRGAEDLADLAEVRLIARDGARMGVALQWRPVPGGGLRR
jgi:hypothetical protein